MDGRCGAAVRNMASGLACSVMGQIGTAAWPQATAPPSVVEHVVLVDARLWQESHGEIERHLRPNAEAVYIARPCEVAIYLHGKTKEQLAAIKSINLLFHGSPYDATDQPIAKDDEELGTKATSIEVLGSRLSVKANEVAEMVSITPTSTPEQRQASRLKYQAYWELRDAMVLLWDATETQKAPFLPVRVQPRADRGVQGAVPRVRTAGVRVDRRDGTEDELGGGVGERGRRRVCGGEEARGAGGVREAGTNGAGVANPNP